jgi:hypothetical protein
MTNRKCLGGLFAFVILAALPGVASAQNPAQNRAQAAKYSALEGRPTVSPYLNLTGNTNLASYQTLVRPIIDEREELNRQWARLDQLNQQLGGAPGAVGPGDQNRNPTRGRGTSAVRFLHYSHYYGTR